MGSVIFDSDVENFLLKLPAYLPAWPASVFRWKPSMYAEACLWMFIKVPSSWLCLLFFQERTGLISLSDWSWRLLLHGDVWLLNSISRNDRSGKITGFFCIVCSFCAFLVKKSWMQLNTDHKKACLLKDFFLDIFQNVGFVCFRMCWRILMTLLLQLAVVEVHQELPLVTIWQDQNSSKL